MSCYHPIYALKLHVINSDTGKEKIKVLPTRVDENYQSICRKYGKDNILCLPCGHCPSCIEKRSRAWAARCILEASAYPFNSFITLTYREGCVPKGGLCKKDLQNFIKRLRKRHPGVRYFGCGEYGSNTIRPHYHLILFNYFPSDAKYLTTTSSEGRLFTSKELSQLWPFGFSSVGEVTFASCGYVARYCQKKLGNKKYKDEFSIMSLKPGIGAKFFNEHVDTIYETDKVYFKFGDSPFCQPFRYYDEKFKLLDSAKFESIKNERISNANTSIASDMLLHCFDHVEKLLKYKETIKISKMSRLKRKDV